MAGPHDAIAVTTSPIASVGLDDTGAPVSDPSEPGGKRAPLPSQLLCCLAMARPHHYGKNVLVLAGILLAYAFVPAPVTPRDLLRFVAGFVATCLVASSNYVLNEALDAGSDRFHPRKRQRPAPSGRVSPGVAGAVWLVLGAAGLTLAACLGRSFFSAAAALLVMGLAYNIPPVRLKDLPYVDVLSEAANSPIRLLIGWTLVLPGEPPGPALIVGFWAAGAFAMSWKRLRELRFLKDPLTAAAYRRSFAHYNGSRLIVFMTLSASVAAFSFACVCTSFV